jgi:hypothetical protein
MEREVEALLLAGAPGFAVLHDFFHQADIDHEKILILTHDPQLLYALLHLVALHPDDVAALSNYLMEATADRPQSFIRREVFNFVPVFLNHHKGKYPELRERLKNEIDLQIEKGAYYLDKVFLAMRDLGHSSPVPPLAALLDDPQKKEMHPTIIDHLANRGPDGMAALVAFAQEGKNPQLPSLGLALKAIAAKSEGGKTAEFRRFLEHPAPAVRLTALRVYFEFPRDLDDLPLARQFLDSETGLGSKRSFIAALRRRNGHLLDALASEPDRIALAEVRVLVEREAAAAQAQKQRGASPPSVPSPRAR